MLSFCDEDIFRLRKCLSSYLAQLNSSLSMDLINANNDLSQKWAHEKYDDQIKEVAYLLGVISDEYIDDS